MIAVLYGVVSEKIAGVVVLDVSGVGYGLTVPVDDFSRYDTGEKVKFYIYEHIRDQSYDLFGFSLLGTKALFEQLLGVKNVGPKAAMAILDIGSADMVKGATFFLSLRICTLPKAILALSIRSTS